MKNGLQSGGASWHLAVLSIAVLVLYRGVVNGDAVIVALACCIGTIHGIYSVRPDALLAYTSNVYWKSLMLMGALLLLLLGIGHADPIVVVAGAYSFLSKLGASYWADVFKGTQD